MNVPGHTIVLPIEQHATSLPVLCVMLVSKQEKISVGFECLPQLRMANTNSMDTLSLHPVCELDPVYDDNFHLEHDQFDKVCCISVASDGNWNLSNPQDELLMWQRKLGVSMYHAQEMIMEHKVDNEEGQSTITLPVITPKFKSTFHCPVTKCTACLLDQPIKRNSKVKKDKAVEEQTGASTWDRYKAGDFVLMDQFVVKITGLLPSDYGSIFFDAAFGII